MSKYNTLRKIDLGLVHSSAANSPVELILSRLKQEDIVVDGVSPSFLTRFWPAALPEWSTKSVRDAFSASPKFPRLLKADAVIKDTISRGLDGGTIAYVGKSSDGGNEPFVYKRSLGAGDVEIADDAYLIVCERAEEYDAKKDSRAPGPTGARSVARRRSAVNCRSARPVAPAPGGYSEPPPGLEIYGFQWTGEISPEKWMNFYTKALSRFATASDLKLTITVDVDRPGGTTMPKVQETKVALRELGMPEDVSIKRGAGS